MTGQLKSNLTKVVYDSDGFFKYNEFTSENEDIIKRMKLEQPNRDKVQSFINSCDNWISNWMNQLNIKIVDSIHLKCKIFRFNLGIELMYIIEEPLLKNFKEMFVGLIDDKRQMIYPNNQFLLEELCKTIKIEEYTRRISFITCKNTGNKRMTVTIITNQ